MLNPGSPVPLYRQLADELEARIRRGELAEGARLPGEHDLARTHRIGRPTVRQATDHLVRRGLLERRRGSGTYVTKPREAVDLFTLSGTFQAFARTGLELRMKLLAQPRLDDAEGDGHPVYRMTRLGSLGARPVLVEEFELDAAIFPGLEGLPVAQRPLSDLAREHYDRVPVGGRQSLSVGRIGSRHAKALRASPRTPALVIERWLDFAGAPGALFARMLCLTDRVELVQTLAPGELR